jgi:hypothetical protein
MKKISILAGALCLAALVGCNKEEGQTSREQGNLTIEIQTAKTRGLTGNSEVGLPTESVLKTLEFYIFNADGTVLDNKTANNNGYYIVTDPTNLKREQTLKVGEGIHKVVVVANMGLGEGTALDTYDEVMAAINKAAFSKSNSTLIPTGGLEMSGVAVTPNVTTSGSYSVEIDLQRLVSKVTSPKFSWLDDAGNAVQASVDLSDSERITLWGADTEGKPLVSSTATINFRYQGHVVINGLPNSNTSFVSSVKGSNGLYVGKDPIGTPWTNWSLTGKGDYLTSTHNTDGSYTSSYSSATGAFLGASDVVYLFENMPKEKTATSGVTGWDPDAVNSFIIKGELSTTGQTAQIRYWRVNFTRDEDHHTLRNNVYKTTIQSIVTPGFSNPEDAEDDEEIIGQHGDAMLKFVVDVNEWDINEYSGEM